MLARQLILAAGAAAAALTSSHAFAQSTEPASTALEEVVVTAERRSQNLQQVPIAVTAITASSLARSGVSGIVDLLNVAPGFVVTRQLKSANTFIRGVGNPAGGNGNEAGVATYVDGVYYVDQGTTLFSFNNIQSIEVLKGPQGTLFGRNATGGLVNVRTRDPKPTPAVEGALTYSNYNTWEGALYATGGTDDLAADIALYSIRQLKGWGHAPDVGGADVNRLRDIAVRSKLLWTPNDDTRVTLAGDFTESKGDVGLTRNGLPGVRLVGGVAPVGSIYDGGGTVLAQFPVSNTWGVSLHYEQQMDWAKLSVLNAYRATHITAFYDQDLTRARTTEIRNANASLSWQSEVLLTGSTDKIDWVTGAFVFLSRAKNKPQAVRGAAAAANVDLWSTSTLRSYAGFAQATYAITDTTRITGGLRYTIDKREIYGQRLAAPGNALPVGSVLLARADADTFKKLTFRAALDHQFTDAILGYVSFNRGFKSGTFNLNDLSSPSVRPETLDAFEAGLKSELFDRLLRVNLAAFHYKYKDIQLVRTIPGGSQLFNAAAGKLDGLEAEVSAAPPVAVGRLQLNAGLALLDAKYSSFSNGPRLTPTPAPGGGNTTAAADLSGNRMIRSPKWTLNLSADYTVPVGAGELGANLSYYYNDGYYWEPDNRLTQGAYNVLNAQVSYAFGADLQYKVRLWAKNLADEVYYASQASSALGDIQAPAAPRTYGVTVEFKY